MIDQQKIVSGGYEGHGVTVRNKPPPPGSIPSLSLHGVLEFSQDPTCMIRNTSTGIGPRPMSGMTSDSVPQKIMSANRASNFRHLNQARRIPQFFGQQIQGNPIRREAFISLEADMFMNDMWSISADKMESFLRVSSSCPDRGELCTK